MSRLNENGVTTPKAADAIRADLAACRVGALHDVASGVAREDARAVKARIQVYERAYDDLRRLGVHETIRRAAVAYRKVPIVPKRLLGRHPAARGRGEALEQVLLAAGVDAPQLESIRRVRPRYVDDPQAAS